MKYSVQCKHLSRTNRCWWRWWWMTTKSMSESTTCVCVWEIKHIENWRVILIIAILRWLSLITEQIIYSTYDDEKKDEDRNRRKMMKSNEFDPTWTNKDWTFGGIVHLHCWPQIDPTSMTLPQLSQRRSLYIVCVKVVVLIINVCGLRQQRQMI
jgi:hypothetical protein